MTKISSSLKLFQYYKELGQKSLERIPDDKLTHSPSEGMNSAAQIVKHLRGNMLSRWTNFLTEDGEKVWRNRDSEFENPPTDRSSLLEAWEEGWQCLFDSLENLSESDLGKSCTIRGEKIAVFDAIERQISHYAYHVGQIVFLAQFYSPEPWESLSIPKGKSLEYNQNKNPSSHFTESL